MPDNRGFILVLTITWALIHITKKKFVWQLYWSLFCLFSLFNKMRCAVKNCNSDNDSKASNISFFAFPSDPALLKQWISFCCRKETFNVKNAVICIFHFKPEDIANKMEYDMGFNKRRRLKPGSVPSIKNKEAKQKISKERQQRIEKREIKKTVEDLIKEYESVSASSVEQTSTNFSQDMEMEIDLPTVMKHDETCDETNPLYSQEENFEDEQEMKHDETCDETNPLYSKEEIFEDEQEIEIGEILPTFSKKHEYEEEIELLKSELAILRGENFGLKTSKRKLEEQLAAVSEKMQEQSKNHELEMDALNTKFKRANFELRNLESKLLTIFTNGQINKLKAGMKRRTWTEEDIAHSVTLYAASSKLYRTLYKKNFPLPAVSTLQKWAHKADASNP